MDWRIAAEYIDHGISGAKGHDRRPGYDRLYNAIDPRERCGDGPNSGS
jgi:hypothetical protein